MHVCLTVAAFSAVVPGCATFGVHGLSSGQPWRELTGAHFILKTDLPEGDASDELESLERTREALLEGAWSKAQLEDEKIEVICLKDSDELGEFSGQAGGWASGTFHPRIVEALGVGDVRAHEMAHALSNRLIVRQPAWFAEGLASFLETIQLSQDSAELGNVNERRFRELQAYGLMPTSRVLTFGANERVSASPNEVLQFYATSWLLVHYLFNEQGSRFAEYQKALGLGRDPIPAWTAVFPDLPPGKDLDLSLTKYLQSGSFHVYRVALSRGARPKPVERNMADVEVHLLRANLFLTAPGLRPTHDRFELANRELDPLLATDPWNPELIHARPQRPERAVELLRESTRHRPEDPRAWTYLAGALAGLEQPSTSERVAAARRATELAPDDPSALEELAEALVDAGQPEEALPLARRSVSLAPSHDALVTLAKALADTRQCDEARMYRQRALDGINPEYAQIYRAVLGQTANVVSKCPSSR